MVSQDTCIFCQIINKTLPSIILYEDERVLVIKDRAPQAPIHYLIIPKKHYIDVTSFTEKDSLLMSDLWLTAKKLSALSEASGQFKLIVNNGAAAGQIIFHVHIHFLAGLSENVTL